ncbi:hypothetical protein [uncultured Roseivirga sp.]|uniref:hypothetical protein n=1 Tax=uncultured Roseivirga sp. TaxID=543088 RepID=UPI0030DB106D|tara:strand:- start:68442 stop:69038 length:597 start_codon:yes stop_codon:yes gene_type:complete
MKEIFKLYFKLTLTLSIAILSACSGDEIQVIEEIQITGGHQVERVDGQFEFKYGLFNDQGQPTTKFNQGDKIIFSFWIVNNGNVDSFLDWAQYEDFFRVYKLVGVDSRADLGQPHIGMFCNKSGGRYFNSQGLIKFELPWVVPADGIDGGHLWCIGRNAPPLEKGSYRTAFDQSFEFSDSGRVYETDVLSFSIDFTVN